MRLILNQHIDPAFNLALEEYALRHMAGDIIMLWRNRPAVIVGRNQNTVAEVNLAYARKQGIEVIRRQSGGGAVYHDLGNINYTMVSRQQDPARLTGLFMGFLRGQGLEVEQQGRNDLLLNGAKFSGHARASYQQRHMHHGCILFSTDLSHLEQVLTPPEIKLSGKGVASVRARVCTLAAQMPDTCGPEDFMRQLAVYFETQIPGLTNMPLRQNEVQAVRQLAQGKYSQWQWNVGKSPACDMRLSRKFAFGMVEIHMQLEQGIIKHLHIFGDFFSQRDKSGLEQALTGLPLRADILARALAGLDVGRYIDGMGSHDLLDMLPATPPAPCAGP